MNRSDPSYNYERLARSLAEIKRELDQANRSIRQLKAMVTKHIEERDKALEDLDSLCDQIVDESCGLNFPDEELSV